MGLDIEIGVKDARVKQGLEQIRGHARKFSADVSKMIASSFSGIGAAFTLGGVLGSLNQIIAKTSEIKKLSLQFGVGTQALQNVGNGLAKGNLEAVAPLLNKLIINQEHAREGNKKLAASFDTLGISQQELNSLAPDELLYRIADGTKNCTDRGAAYNAVVSIMGKSAGAFFAKLEQGSAVLKQNAADMGTYSKAAIDSFAGFGKQVNNLKSQVLPTLAEVGAKVLSFFSQAWSAKGMVLKFGMKLVTEGQGGAEKYADEWLANFKKQYGYSQKPAEKGKGPTGEAPAGYSGDGDQPGDGGPEESTASRLAALREKQAQLETAAAEKTLSAELLITDLKDRQARLVQEAAEAREDKDEEGALQKEIEAAELGNRAAAEQARLNREKAAVSARIAALERESQLASLSVEERIVVLRKERERLLWEERLATFAGDKLGAEQKRLEAAERLRDIEKETKTLLDEQERSIEKMADAATSAVVKKANRNKERKQDAERDEQQIAQDEHTVRERRIARLPAAQQRQIRALEKSGIDAEAVGVQTAMSAETNPDKKRKLRVRLADLSVQSEEKRDQLADLDKQIAGDEKPKERRRPSVGVADSLQRVGGGGGIAAADQSVRQRDKAIDKLEEIRRLLAKGAPVQGRPTPEDY